MSTPQESREKAWQQYEIARHLLLTTFPMVRDNKLLPAILSNLSNAVQHALDAILLFEREAKLIPPYGTTFEAKVSAFRLKCLARNKIPLTFYNLMTTLHDLAKSQKAAPVEFSRKDKYIICSAQYETKAISAKDLKEYLQQTKDFLMLTDTLMNRFNRKE